MGMSSIWGNGTALFSGITKKVLEEAPSIAIGQTLRTKIKRVIRAAASVGYENAGTIEFLLDEAKGEFYFMEMNTRVQVEQSCHRICHRSGYRQGANSDCSWPSA